MVQKDESEIIDNRLNGFTTSDALNCFGIDMLDLDVCRLWILKRIRPAGAVCSSCGLEIKSDRVRATFMNDGRVCCKDCGVYFNNRKGTILEDSKLSWRELYLLAVLTELGMKQEEISRRVSVHSDTVSVWQSKFKTIAGVVNDK